LVSEYEAGFWAEMQWFNEFATQSSCVLSVSVFNLGQAGQVISMEGH